MLHIPRVALLALIPPIVAACGDGSTAPDFALVALVIVQPDSVAVAVERDVQLHVTLQDRAGNTLPERLVAWNSSDTNTARVDSTGVVYGVEVGRVTITAVADGRSDSAAVRVAEGYTSVAASVNGRENFSCGVTFSHRLYCWGSGSFGTLGRGDSASSAAPVRSGSDAEFVQVSVGSSHACAVAMDGRAYCWGHNDEGELGDGSTVGRPVPTPVSGGLSFRMVDAGFQHTCGVTEAGPAYCWGANRSGQLGDGTEMPATQPVAVVGGLTFRTVSSGEDHTCGLTDGGLGYCWGSNSHGQLGADSTPGRSLVPVRAAASLTFTSLSAGRHLYTCGVASSGTPYCWGHNDMGQLGRGTATTAEPTVAPVMGDLVLDAIDGGAFHTCGVGAAGAAYCWGFGDYGQLGDGQATSSYVPVRVAGDQAFTSVATGLAHTCAITVEGSAYCWGFNSDGELGDGTAITRSKPVRVANSL